MVLRRTFTYIIKSLLVVSFGEVANRKRRHPSEGVSGHLGASRNEASGIRGTRVPGRKVVRSFLGRLTLGPSLVGAVLGRKFSQAFLGRLTLGSGLVEAIGLDRLARGTKLGPMVPTNMFGFQCFFGLKNIKNILKKT